MKRRLRILGFVTLGAVAVAAILFFALRSFDGPRIPADAIVVPRDAATLAEALASASEGATIRLDVSGGPYTEAVVIDVPGLTLVGAGRDVVLATLGSDPAITIRADGVTIRNLGLQSDGIGLRIEADECLIEDLTINESAVGIQLFDARRCSLRRVAIESGRVGIELVSSRGNHLEAIRIEETDEAGLKLLQSVDNVIEEAVIRHTLLGAVLEQASTGNTLLSSTFTDCSETGVVVRASLGNRIEAVSVTGSEVGILLEAVTGNTIADCSIKNTGTAGIQLRQAAQNRVLGNRIEDGHNFGIALDQSAENSISHNVLVRCAEVGIWVDRSDRVLVMANSIEGCAVGLLLRSSDDGRELHNDVRGCSSVGIYLSSCDDHQILDNAVVAGATGIVLASSEDNTLIRNRVVQQAGRPSGLLELEGEAQLGGCAMALLYGSDANLVAANELTDASIGLLVIGSGRLDVTNNALADCGRGVGLERPSPGVRVEGNTIEENDVGLVLVEGGEASDKAAAPVIANNVFRSNREADIRNEGTQPLYAAGNWWDPAGARVEGHVLLQESAWQGTVAVGTASGGAREILGRILQLSLEEAGFRVIDLVGIGDSDRVVDALQERDVDMIWWDTEGSEATEDPDVRIVSVGAAEGTVAIVPSRLAEGLSAMTLTALFDTVQTAGQRIRFAAPSSLGSEQFDSLVAAYAPTPASAGITWVRDISEAEAMVKLGAADVALIDGLEETLTSGNFARLADERGALAASPIVIVALEVLFENHPEIEELVGTIASALTTDVLHDLTSRVRLLGEDSEDVARGFLRALSQGDL